MDIRKLKLVENYRFEPKYLNGDPTGLIFILQSPKCKDAEKVRRKWDNIASRNKKGLLEFDQKREMSKELLGACVVGWENLEDSGKPVEFSKDQLREYLNIEELQFIFDQVAEELLEESNFLTLSGKG